MLFQSYMNIMYWRNTSNHL